MDMTGDIAWVYRHPDLLRQILAKSTGAIGELWVAMRLEKLGYSVRPTNNNSRQCDLQVISPSGTKFSIEVKTIRQRGSPYLVRQCPDETVSAIWFFVHAPRDACDLPVDDDMSFFILTTAEAAAIWREINRVPSSAPDIRWSHIRDHLDRWDKLPQ